MSHSSGRRLFALLAIIPFYILGQALAAQAAQAGVVVEELPQGSSGEKANLRPGDMLLSWERPANPPANPEKAEGKIESVFDWMWVEMEQGPRGTAKVRGERDGKEVSFEVPVGIWGIKVRPTFQKEALKTYTEGKAAVNSKDLERGIALWGALAKSAEAANNTNIACWVSLRIGDTWAEARRWAEAHGAYETARRMAETAPNAVAQAVTWDAIGKALEKENKLQEAEEAYQSAMAIREKVSSETLSVSRSLNNQGVVARKRGDLATAEAYHKRALAIREKLAPDSLDLASSLQNLGVVARNRGDLATAEAYSRRALAIREKLAPDSLDLAGSLDNLGAVAAMRGDLATAEAYSRRTLAIREKLAPDSLDLASSLQNLGNVAYARGDLMTAEAYQKRALAIKEKLTPDSLDLAESLNNLGAVATMRGDLETAEAYQKRALAIQERLAPDSLDLAGPLINLGVVARDRGDLITAEAYSRRALAIQEKLAPDSLDLAGSLDNLGSVAAMRGDLATAEAYFKRALVIREKLAPDSLDLAYSLQNLGNVAYARGDLMTAEAYQKRALAIKEKLTPDSLDLSTSLGNLGAVARDRGDLTTAEAYIKRALGIREKLAPDSLDLARSLNDLGVVARDRGDLTTAEACQNRALAIQEKRAPDSLDLARSLNNLAVVARDRGDLMTAEPYFKRALVIRAKLGPGSTDEAESQHDLGLLYRKANQDRLAADHFQRAVDALEAQVGKLGGTQEAETGFRAKYGDYYRDYIDVLVALNQPEDAFRILERSRARTLLAMLAERDLVFAADLPKETERERKRIAWEYDQTQARLEQLNPAKDPAQIEGLLNGLRELRDRQSQMVEQIRQQSPRLASLQYPRPLDVRGVQAALDPATVLLSYSLGKEKSYLFALTADAGLQAYTLALGEAQLREEVEKFRSLIERAQLGAQELTGLVDRGKRLYERLIQPAAKTIERAQRVLVLPDGPLHLLPFAALIRSVDAKPGTADKPAVVGGAERHWLYLVEWKPLHVVVSATVYAELRKQRQHRPEKETRKTLVALGDPKYPAFGIQESEKELDKRDAVLRSILTRGYRLTPLPSTKSEVAAIAELYREKADTFVGAAATEERAKGVAKETKYLHFACHGLLDERFPLDSGLALTIPDDVKEGQENGILQAWEIFERVRIDADLVVLSACETGLGKEMGGEGLVGLTRAFEYAGARSVLASLWSVADETTAALMKRFYRYLKAGQSKDAALRQAQLDLIRSSISIQGQKGAAATLDASHPFYWAAFQLNGDWR
jgi:CHAT domain-containing protein/Tfp pilus assembly protein PilF